MTETSTKYIPGLPATGLEDRFTAPFDCNDPKDAEVMAQRFRPVQVAALAALLATAQASAYGVVSTVPMTVTANYTSSNMPDPNGQFRDVELDWDMDQYLADGAATWMVENANANY